MIQNHQDKSLLLNRLVGPFLEQPLVHYVSSLLSIVPKSDLGKIQIIHEYHIHKMLLWTQHDAQGHFAGPLYVFIDDIVRLVFPFGRGYLMVNTVIKNAIRIIPMIPLISLSPFVVFMEWKLLFWYVYYWTPAAQFFFQI